MTKYRFSFVFSADRGSIFLVPTLHLQMPYKATEGLNVSHVSVIWLGFSAGISLFAGS